MQAFFLQDVEHVFSTFDVALGQFAFQKFRNGCFHLISIRAFDLAIPARGLRVKEISLVGKKVAGACRIVRPCPAFAPVEEVAEDGELFLPSGRASIEILAAGKLHARDEEVEFVMSGVAVPYPEYVPLIGFESGKCYSLESVHNVALLRFVHIIVGMPCEHAGREFPTPFDAVDELGCELRIAAKHFGRMLFA